MHNEPLYLLEPVFHWLDALIRRNGDYLYMVLVYISLPLVAWILNGGLRRRWPRRSNSAAVPTVVIWVTTPPPPLRPGDARRCQPRDDEDSQSFAA